MHCGPDPLGRICALPSARTCLDSQRPPLRSGLSPSPRSRGPQWASDRTRTLVPQRVLRRLLPRASVEHGQARLHASGSTSSLQRVGSPASLSLVGARFTGSALSPIHSVRTFRHRRQPARFNPLEANEESQFLQKAVKMYGRYVPLLLWSLALINSVSSAGEVLLRSM